MSLWYMAPRSQWRAGGEFLILVSGKTYLPVVYGVNIACSPGMTKNKAVAHLVLPCQLKWRYLSTRLVFWTIPDMHPSPSSLCSEYMKWQHPLPHLQFLLGKRFSIIRYKNYTFIYSKARNNIPEQVDLFFPPLFPSLFLFSLSVFFFSFPIVCFRIFWKGQCLWFCMSVRSDIQTVYVTFCRLNIQACSQESHLTHSTRFFLIFCILVLSVKFCSHKLIIKE